MSQRFVTGRRAQQVVALILAFGAVACSKGKNDVSAVQGIGDGDKNSVGFIPVRNDANLDLSGIDTDNLGALYARDLIQMPLFAMVQCRATDTLPADGWMLRLETAAQTGDVKLNKDRDIVLPGIDGKDSQLTACVVIGERLLSYPVANKMLEIARTGSATSAESLASSQFFYLAMKGYEDRAKPNRTTPLVMHYGSLVREHLGAAAPSMEQIAAKLAALDPMLNPCSKAAPKDQKLKEWRNGNYTCEKLDVPGDIYGYVPTKDFTKLRDATAAKVASIHETLNPGTSDATSKLWDVLTSTKSFDSYSGAQKNVADVLKGNVENFEKVFGGEKYGAAPASASLTGGFNLGPRGGCTCPQLPNSSGRVFTASTNNRTVAQPGQQGRNGQPATGRPGQTGTQGRAAAPAAGNPNKPFTDFSALRTTVDGATGTHSSVITNRVNENLAALETTIKAQKDASGGQAATNTQKSSLFAMRAMADANGDKAQVEKIDGLLKSSGVKQEDIQHWKVDGLGGGAKGQDYTRVMGDKGQLAFFDNKTGQQQTWVSAGDTFDKTALDAMAKNGTGSTGAAKTAANTDVRFEQGTELTTNGNPRDFQITGGRWRADTTVPGKGVVDTQMGVKFNNGLNDGKGPSVAVATKTEGGYAVPDKAKAQQNHDTVLAAAKETNDAIRARGTCDKIEKFEADSKAKSEEANKINNQIGELAGKTGLSSEEQAANDKKVIELGQQRDKLFADAATAKTGAEESRKTLAAENAAIEQNTKLAKEANVGITEKELGELGKKSCAKLTGGFALDACGDTPATDAAAATGASDKKTAETVADPNAPGADVKPAASGDELKAPTDTPVTADAKANQVETPATTTPETKPDASNPSGTPAQTTVSGNDLAATEGGTKASDSKEVITPGQAENGQVATVAEPTKQDFTALNADATAAANVAANAGNPNGTTGATADELAKITGASGGTDGGTFDKQISADPLVVNTPANDGVASAVNPANAGNEIAAVTGTQGFSANDPFFSQVVQTSASTNDLGGVGNATTAGQNNANVDASQQYGVEGGLIGPPLPPGYETPSQASNWPDMANSTTYTGGQNAFPTTTPDPTYANQYANDGGGAAFPQQTQTQETQMPQQNFEQQQTQPIPESAPATDAGF